MIKIQKTRITSLSLLGFLAISFTANGQIVLDPTNDTFVQADQPNSSFGSDTAVRARLTSPFDDGSQKAWLMFDGASSGFSTITDVLSLEAVALAASPTSRRGAQFYLVTGTGADSWDEATATWNNVPGNDTTDGTDLDTTNFSITLLGSTPQAANQGDTVALTWETGAKTALLNELNTGDRLATIVATRDSTSGNMNYASLNSTTNNPVQLTVIPEPSVYAAFLGVLALAAVGMRRRIR